MMSATLALRFTQKGAEKTTEAVTKLAQAVAQIQAAAAQPITIQLPRVGGGGGGGGGGRSREASPEAMAAKAEAAAAKQAAAAEKAAAKQQAAAEKAAASAEKASARQAAAAERTAARQVAAAEKAASRQQAAADRLAARQAAAAEKAAAKVREGISAYHGQQEALRGSTAASMGFGSSIGALVPSLSTMATAAAVGAAAVVGLVKAAIDGASALAGLAAEGERLKVIGAAYEKLGGSADELKKLREMTGNVVGDTDLQKAMNLAKLFKLPAEEVPKLVKLAQGAGAALGESTAKMLSDTFTAASRGSKMIADNMGIVMGDLGQVYEDYAKKVGKTSGDQLTDQQRTAAFVSKMVAEGGRQMELATIAQGDAAAQAAAHWDNLSGNLMVAVAEMFRSLGVWDMLGSAMSGFEKFAGGGIAAAGEYLAPLFRGLADIIPPVVRALGALLPLVQPLGQALSYVGAVIEPLVPIIGMVSSTIGFLASGIIDLVSLGLEPLLAAGAEVAGLVSDDMGDAFKRASDAMANARVRIDVVNEGLEQQKEKTGNAEQGWGKLRRELEHMGRILPAQDMGWNGLSKLAADNAGVVGGELDKLGKRMAALGGSMSTAGLNEMVGTIDRYKEQLMRMGKSEAEAEHRAAEIIAETWNVRARSTGDAVKDILATHKTLKEQAAAMAKAGAEDQIKAQRDAVDSLNRLYYDVADAGNEYASLTNDIWTKAGGDEKKALEELDKWRSDHIAAAATVFQDDIENYSHAMQKIAKIHEAAMNAMGLADTTAIDDLMRRGEEAGKSRAELATAAAQRQLTQDLATAGANAEARAAAEKVYAATLKDAEGKGGGGGRGKGSMDSMKGLMERAAQQGMSERQLALFAADKQFAEDLKAAGKNAEGIAAAQSLYAQARVKAWMDAGRGQVEALKTGSGALRAVAAAWLEDAAAAVEMVKAAEQTLTRHRLGTEEVGVGDSAEGITRRRTAREVEVQMEVEALRQEWEAKAATLQVGSEAYLTVLAEHQRKVAELTKEGDAEKAKADAEAATEARLAMFAGFGEVFGQVQGQLDGMLESGDGVQEAVAATLGGFIALGSEIEGTKAELAAIQEKVNKGQLGETQAGVAGAGLMAAAIGRASRSIVKDKQAQAYVEALIQVGLAAAAYATGNFGGGVAHTAAAASLFVAAGRGGGGGAAARSLTPRRSAAGADRASQAGERQSVQQQINIFMNPLTGQAMVGAINSAGQRRAGVQLNSRVIPTGPRRPDL